jgi:hypothetical protein
MINRKYLFVPVLAIAVIICVTLVSGVIPVRFADTHNATLVVNEYNTWVQQQKPVDSQVRFSLEQMGEHIGMFNAEIIKENPDANLLRENVATDRQLIAKWGTDVGQLDSQTTIFSETADSLDLSASPDGKETASLMKQDMKIYVVHMKNAQQHLVDYVNRCDAYLADANPDYWNDEYREAAMDAKSKAAGEIAQGDEALAALSSAAQKLAGSQ